MFQTGERKTTESQQFVSCVTNGWLQKWCNVKSTCSSSNALFDVLQWLPLNRKWTGLLSAPDVISTGNNQP